ncbi:response regulator [Bacteroides sartorii]|uniref:hybrid sensor histidine kinase/response regulator transcription factor n=1 Tax=Phocaeicola sartorii TaxID=671267 RepID=UPI0015858735|nr:two-component regulator propeller domain-containing protein [Phocaeicola sartorii]NUK97683.1 response regulator [Phocaeicola sartorii]
MRKPILSILFLLISVILLAVPNDFRFRHFSVEDGLSSNSVRAIMQDKYGFLWIGTEEGLNRYDGTMIKSYPICPKTAGKYISSLYETKNNIWIGTDEGIYIYSYATETFVHFNLTTPNNIRITNTVNHILEDKDGNLWFSTNGQGLFRYNPPKNYLEQYEFKSASEIIASTMIDSDNQIWALTNQGESGVYKLNKAENKFEPFELLYNTGEHRSQALAMLEDSEQTLWLGTWECGLQKIDKYTRKTTTYLHPTDRKGVTHIHSLMEYAPHQLLIGSDDGLLLFNTLTEEYKLFTENETTPNSLSNRFVYPIIKDREGGIWIGTYYGGINYISPNAEQFESFSHSRLHNSVNGNVIGRFCEDAHGQIWIASDDGGLNRYSPEDRKFVHYLPADNKNSLSYHNVHALCMDEDNLWIGTYTGGVNVLNLQTGIFKVYHSYTDVPTSLDGTSSYAIFKDRSDRIWVASMNGINLYNREEDNFIRIKNLDALTIDIDQDTKGNLWFSTQGKGLFKYHPEKQIWKNYIHDHKNPNSLANNQVNCVLIDTNGEMWVGTMNGLCKYNAEEDAFETLTLEIPSHNICSIIEDQRILWLTTTKGLVRYSPGEGCRVFTKSDGLQSEQFLPNAAFKASDGKIYIGSVNGFNAFYPYQIKTNVVLPPVVITELEIGNKQIPVGDKLLPKSLNQLKELELSYKENAFSLLYASLSYCTPNKNKYAYKLEGFDKDWNYVGSQNKATYTNLPAGTYLFKVKATNNDGIWNEKGTSLKITIHPPFYWCTASKLLYFVLVCIAFGFVIRFIIKRTEKKHTAEINKLNANKEKEVHEAKIKFFTMIAHEIRTPVSLIIGPLEKIMKSPLPLPATVRDDLNIIDRNSQRLLFLVNQLLDFRKVEQEEMKMKFASQNIHQLLKAVCERFEPFIAQHGARLTVEYPDAGFTAIVDSEAVTKLVSNLLTNASKYTKDEVILACITQPEQHTFTIRVTDNGIGISKEEQKKIFHPFYQAMNNKPGTGIGLSIVKSIVESHNGCIEVESEVNKGSSFIVTLPVEQAQVLPQDTGTSLLDNPAIPEDILQESLPGSPVKHKPAMLIVDDNEEMLNFLSGSLADRYSILTAEDGVEALEKLKENEVTLIVSDWMMPRMDGVEFCKAVRASQTTSHIPFILLTAKTDTNSKIEGMDCGADAYIEKPFSMQYLEACIKNLVDLRNLLRQKFSKMPLVPLNSIANNSMDDKFLTRMNEIIEENFSNPELSVDFLAEQLCISRSGLFGKIKTLANITPNELIQVVRLKKAAALLAENKYRINEICYMVGFNNPSYFSKCFQKQFGMKPGEFVNGKRNSPPVAEMN